MLRRNVRARACHGSNQTGGLLTADGCPALASYLHVAAGEELRGVAAVGALAVDGADLEATLWGL